MTYTTPADIHRHCDIPDPVLFLERNGWKCIGQRGGEAIWKLNDGRRSGERKPRYLIMGESRAVAYEIEQNEKREGYGTRRGGWPV